MKLMHGMTSSVRRASPPLFRLFLVVCLVAMPAAHPIAATVSYPLDFPTGWNLAGNSLTTPIVARNTFGTQPGIESVWKWDAMDSKWSFYAPSLDTSGTLASYAASKGYSVLTTINPGDGFWVKALAATGLGTQSGSGISLAPANLARGWNLAATADDITPPGLAARLGNVTSIWAWDHATSGWYFYAPSLEADGTLAAYLQSRGYKDFGNLRLAPGLGFWVNYGAQAGTAISDADASRFLSQAAMGASRDQIARVRALGYAGWIDEQLALPQETSRWDWLISNGFGAATYKNSEAGFDAASWQKLIGSNDTLRQRVTLALSEILVVGIDGLSGGWRSFTAAAYLDLLESHAFGNYRSLLEAVSRSPAMGEWLTFRANLKANPATGSQPDENYAREVLQLFTIGLVQLNPDGTPVMANGSATDTYSLPDIVGLARVFTGWDWDLAGGSTDTPDFQRRPMVMNAARHETGAKSFLGTTIAAGTDGNTSLKIALDTLAAQPNVAPFVGRQLIQRLVTSNPSPAYVGRVAAVFNNDGNGIKGNLAAVIKAILLDDEARNAISPTTPTFGKLKEPMLRFTAWARAFKASSASGAWAVGNTSDPASRLGQSPLRSPSVFNFFRPGYMPPNSSMGAAGFVGPEFQIVNESSVVGYVNFMQRAVSTGIGDVLGDYGSLLPLADSAQVLVGELNTVLAGGALGAGTVTTMVSALNTMPGGSDAARMNRIHAALTMVLAAPEFIVQK